MSGFIIVPRRIARKQSRPAPIRDSRHFDAWIQLVSEAEWEPGGRPDRGQVLATQRDLAKLLGMPLSGLQRWLDAGSKSGLIQVKSGSDGTLITICNYEDYQGELKESGSRSGQDRVKSEVHTLYNKKTNKVFGTETKNQKRSKPAPLGGLASNSHQEIFDHTLEQLTRATANLDIATDDLRGWLTSAFDVASPEDVVSGLQSAYNARGEKLIPLANETIGVRPNGNPLTTWRDQPS